VHGNLGLVRILWQDPQSSKKRKGTKAVAVGCEWGDESLF
jgi:hypothetical protein